MSRSLAAFDRFLVFLLALLFAFFGVWSILYYVDNEYAKRLADFNNQSVWREAFTADWFKWALIGVFVVSLVLGLWFILANLRRRRIEQVHSQLASTEDGDIRFNIRDIGQAVAAQLADTPGVNKVTRLVSMDRGRPTMEFTLQAPADTNIYAIRSQIDQAERDIREAIADADIDTIYRIHLDPVER